MGSLTGKPELTNATPITNDGFWPDLQVIDFVSKYRIPAEYDSAVIIHGLTLAMYSTNSYLQAVQDALQENGYNSMVQASEDESVETQALYRYQEAVYCRAKAMLLQQFNTVNRKPNAENAAKTAPETEDYFMGQAAFAVSQLFALFGVAGNENSNYGDGVYVGLI